MKGIRTLLRERYACYSCMATPGEYCITGDGKKTQPHESRWTQYRTRERSRPKVRFTNPGDLPREPGAYDVRVIAFDLVSNTTTLEYLGPHR